MHPYKYDRSSRSRAHDSEKSGLAQLLSQDIEDLLLPSLTEEELRIIAEQKRIKADEKACRARNRAGLAAAAGAAAGGSGESKERMPSDSPTKAAHGGAGVASESTLASAEPSPPLTEAAIKAAKIAAKNAEHLREEEAIERNRQAWLSSILDGPHTKVVTSTIWGARGFRYRMERLMFNRNPGIDLHNIEEGGIAALSQAEMSKHTLEWRRMAKRELAEIESALADPLSWALKIHGFS